MSAAATTKNPALDVRRIRAILFDIDGTLSDSDDVIAKKAQNMLRFLELGFPKESVQKLARWLVMSAESPGNALLTLADRLGLDRHLAARLDRRALAQATRPSKAVQLPPIPGVEAVLAELSQRFPLGVVSARNQLTSMTFLYANGFEKYFQVVVTSQTCRYTKPYPDPILYAAKALGLPAQACLMVGDTIPDVRAALAAGAQSLSVLCGFGTERELRAAGTHAILPSTAGLSAYLHELGLPLAAPPDF